MKKLVNLIGSDVRQIVRDRTLLSFIFFPFSMLALLQWGWPALTTRYPTLVEHSDLVLMFASMQSAILFGFVVSFLMVDEKDEQVMDVIRVLPISPRFFLFYRLSFASIVAALMALVVLLGSGMTYMGIGASSCIAFLLGLTAPLITLTIATFANNKIEGMALFKVIDLVLMLPLLAFFLDEPFRYFFGVVPVFWTYALLEQSFEGEWVWWYLGMAVLVYGTVLWGLAIQFRRRVFQR